MVITVTSEEGCRQSQDCEDHLVQSWKTNGHLQEAGGSGGKHCSLGGRSLLL